MSMPKLVTVTFLPSGSSFRAPSGTNLMKAAAQAGVQVDAVCGGKGTCGKCRAKIVEGHVSEITRTEKDHLSFDQIEEGIVLLCQRKILGDVVVDIEISGSSAKYAPGKGNLADSSFEVDAPVKKVYHQLNHPSINDQTADLDRILEQLPGQVEVDANLIQQVPGLLRQTEYSITSVLYNNYLVNIEKGNTVSENYGIAVDIGTTSVAGYLVDLQQGKVLDSASATNRQRSHGGDVISRVNYTVEEPNGLTEMQRLAAQTIDEVVEKLLVQTGTSRDKVYALTLIGNTVMSHLVLGVNPVGVASSPFVPAFSRSVTDSVGVLGLKSLPEYTRFVLLPNVAGYVGSDTIAAILSTKIYEKPGTWLTLDLGTNGEIAISSRNRLLTCSTAAGPAFEGACISQGMRAEPGAIYKVWFAEDVRFKVVGKAEPVGICGSGLIDAVSELVRVGVIRGNGRIKSPEDCPPELSSLIKNRIRCNEKGYRFVLAEGNQEVAITQKDISELQLGKGAMKAGIDLLMEELGIQASDIDGILLAGAFGSSLRPKSLQSIGMLPDVDMNCVQTVGNAAGAGAVMALLSKKQMEIARNLPKRIEHIELSLHKGFPRKFARAINFN